MNAIMISRTSLAVLVSLSVAQGGITGATAQTAAADPAVCMVRMTTGNPRRDRPFYLILPESRTEAWEARGFAITPCEGRERNLPLVSERMCALAARADDVGDGAFRDVHGASAAEICALARELEGGQ